MTKFYSRLFVAAAMASLAMPAIAQSISVKDASGNPQTIRTPNANGRAAAASSAPVALSNEDYARLQSIITALGTPFQSGGSIGNTSFASTVADGANVTAGAKADAAWTTGSGSIVALLKAIDRDALLPLAAGTNQIGTVQNIAATTGGGTNYSLVAANNTTGISIKGSAGQIYSISASNNSTTVAYLKFYDKATAPTCGTDTPVFRLMIPASGGFVAPAEVGRVFTLGIGICVTGGIADADTTAPAAATYLVNAVYK